MSTDTSNQTLTELFETISQANQQAITGLLNILALEQQEEAVHPMSALMKGTEQLIETQRQYYQQQMELWANLLGKPLNQALQPTKTAIADRRFSAPEWETYPFFDFLKQYYLSMSDWMMQLVDQAELDQEAKHKLRFFTRQYIDAISPANFPLTNPEVLKLAIETKGESLLEGLKNVAEDLEKGRISMTDESVFEVGGNLAITPGAVIFENELIQLLQYSPTTDWAYEKPLVIVPPCINKYYLMDLQPDNSLVHYAVSQGFTVFLVSWRSITPELGHLTWDDYLTKGVLRALEVARAITGQDKVNALGFCIGGTLLATALAVMQAKKDKSVNCATFLTTMIDHSDPGDVRVFITEEMVAAREAKMQEGGVIQGKELAATFASLRANELIWSYVVNNYLKGKTPPAFDLLYWNSDATNLPLPMHTFYLRNMYLENNLIQPGAVSLCGVPVDVTKIQLPTYIFAAKEDHIVPWHTAYQSVNLLKGKREFVLGASGHIAGPINPVSKNKRNYWVNSEVGQDPAQWLATAESIPGSWWPHWVNWLAPQSGKKVAARVALGNADYQTVEAAPGRYVKVKAERDTSSSK